MSFQFLAIGINAILHLGSLTKGPLFLSLKLLHFLPN